MDFNDLLNLMMEQKASDLFITADVEPSMKINGQIVPVSKNKLTGEIVGQLIHAIMTDKQRQEFADTRECNFAITNREKTARFRVSAFQQRNFKGCCINTYFTLGNNTAGMFMNKFNRIFNGNNMTFRIMVPITNH